MKTSTFAERLKAARISAGYPSAQQAAAACGLEAATYRTYERGEYQPPIDTLVTIALTFGVSTDELLLKKRPANAA